MKALAFSCVAWLMIACGGGAGRPVAADGPMPTGKGEKRGLVLVEGEPEPAPTSAPGDGTSTPEIVQSVEADKP